MKSTTVALLTNETGAHLGAYFPALADIKEVANVVLSDPSGIHAYNAKKQLGDKLKKFYNSPEELFKHEKPGMALVTVEGQAAPAIIETALDSGVHVFAEKPACTHSDQFEKLAQKADSKHLQLMLAFANRTNPENRFAKKLFEKKSFGDIYGVELNLTADQTRLTRESYHKQWYASKKRGGGGFLTWLAIHWLDLSMYLTGSRIKQVTGMVTNIGGQPIDVEDSVHLTFQYENGSLGSLTSGYYLNRGKQSLIKIWGSNGWMMTDPFTGRYLEYVIYGEKDNQIQKFPGNPQPRGYTPYVRSCIRSTLDLEPAPLTAKESLQVLRTIFSAYKAAESGETQTVDLM